MKNFITALCLALLSGCASPNVSYWSESKDGRGKALVPSEVDPAFFPRLRVVEFDEQGDFWNPAQVRLAQDMIDGCRRPLLITYVHGWLNNGKPTNDDLRNFNAFLKRLSETAIGQKMQVCGVFVAWRGEGVRPEWKWLKIPYYGTFYSRKSATERVANVPLSRTLTVLSEEAHRKTGGKAILIGHSFGGRILERSFGQWLAVEGSRNSSVESIADLVLLINPANESLYAAKIKQALRRRPQDARPVIVSLTSVSDSATKGAWKHSADLRKAVKGSDEFRNYYRAGKIELLLASPTSAGMTPEITHLFQATGLVKESAGGGTEHEDIQVHLVPRHDLRAWLKAKEADGYLIDFKIHAALWAAGI
jgi:ADP-ribose pyrophosphatase